MPTIQTISTHDFRRKLKDGAGSDAVHTDPSYGYGVTLLGTDTGLIGTGIAYTLGDGTNLDASEDVIIGLNGSTVSSMSDVSQVTLAGGDAVQKVSITFDQGGNDAILDLFFADGGNVNSTDLLDRIKFES